MAPKLKVYGQEHKVLPNLKVGHEEAIETFATSMKTVLTPETRLRRAAT